jgi:hypothetical protein
MRRIGWAKTSASKFASFCAKAKNLMDSGKWTGGGSISTISDPAVWKMWPEQHELLPVHLNFFRDPPSREELDGLASDSSDLAVDVIASSDDKERSLQLSWANGKIEFAIFSYVPSSMFATGRVASLKDLQEATLVSSELDNKLALLTPTWINIKTKQSRELTIDNANFKKISVHGKTAYLYKFGNPARSAEPDKPPQK